MAIQNTGEMLPLAEAARRLGVHYLTAWRWTRTGRFPRLTKEAWGSTVRILVPAEDVDRLLAEREGVRHG